MSKHAEACACQVRTGAMLCITGDELSNVAESVPRSMGTTIHSVALSRPRAAVARTDLSLQEAESWVWMTSWDGVGRSGLCRISTPDDDFGSRWCI